MLAWLGIAGYYGGSAIILWRAFYGVISIGTLTFLAGSFARSRAVTERLLSAAGNIYQQGLYVRDLFDFFEMQPTIVSVPGARPVPSPLTQHLVFDDVGFRYPGSNTWAVRHVSLRIAPGEKIALVGENGAGKTTLVKLLARLYDPIKGAFCWMAWTFANTSLSPCAAHRRDLSRPLSITTCVWTKTSVWVISQVQNYLDRLLAATEWRWRAYGYCYRRSRRKSQAALLAASLPLRYRQMLGRRFEGGLELSGGEWQKIALARAYIRKAQIIILDEPTAALDARAEYEAFRRFAHLVAGQTALLISHRFSTVRMADRIVVLRQGAVEELGTHDQLLSHDGLYAELFRLQAEGYR